MLTPTNVHILSPSPVSTSSIVNRSLPSSSSPEATATTPVCPILENKSCARTENAFHLLFAVCNPLPCTCQRRFQAEKWTAMRQSLLRHLLVDHGKDISNSSYWCSVCGGRIKSRQVKYHRCLRGSPLLLQPTVPSKFKCREYPASFPSRKGLENHVRARYPTGRIYRSGPARPEDREQRTQLRSIPRPETNNNIAPATPDQQGCRRRLRELSTSQ